MPVRRPAFLITIDAEGDNLWSRPRVITTHNAAHLGRFQQTCQKYGLRPTHLATWHMAQSEVFREFARDVMARGAGSVGAHLHAWSTPPLVPLTEDDFRHIPYAVEYPDRTIREKLKRLSEALESTFGVKMVSHRAGRWGFNEAYARLLAESGYLVDSSITPHVSWRDVKGDPRGVGGPDFTEFPQSAYFLDLSDIRRAGRSALLEVPVTIMVRRWPAAVERARRMLSRYSLARRVMRRLFPPVHWLRPNGRNRRQMLRILSAAADEGRDYVHFMLHSSELMPGGSPTFATRASVEALYEDIEAVFERARDRFDGMTLREYYHRCRGGDAG